MVMSGPYTFSSIYPDILVSNDLSHGRKTLSSGQYLQLEVCCTATAIEDVSPAFFVTSYIDIAIFGLSDSR